MSWKRTALAIVSPLVVLAMLAACAAPTPEIVEKEVVVEKPVVETVVVEKEKVVEKLVVETVVVEKEVVVTPTPVPELEPVSGGTITVGIREEPPGLDPIWSSSWTTVNSIGGIYDTLLTMDYEANLYPALAESFEVSDDGLHYIFHLRKGVKFHDGTPWNAEAMKYNLERVQDPEYCCGNFYRYVATYESCEVLDEYTIKVNVSKPWGAFLRNMASYYCAWVSPAASEKWGKDLNSHPVGTGPFKFVEYEPGIRVVMERNPDYNWPAEIFDHQGPAYPDRLVVEFIPEYGTRLACLESGECDMIRDPPEAELGRLRDDPRFKVVGVAQKGTPITFAFNTVNPPTDDIRVRKALNLAVNREEIVQSVYSGERVPQYTILSPATPEYWPGAAEYIYYDPEEAKAILEEAGWVDTDGDGIRDKDGQPLTVVLFTFGALEYNPYHMTGEVMQANLRAIGVDVKLERRPFAEQRIVGGTRDASNLCMFNLPHFDAGVLESTYHSREAPKPGHYGMAFTFAHESNPEVQKKLDAVLEEAARAIGFEERKLLYMQAQKIIAENYLVMPTTYGYEFYVMSKKLHGLKFNAHNGPLWYDIWIEH